MSLLTRADFIAAHEAAADVPTAFRIYRMQRNKSMKQEDPDRFKVVAISANGKKQILKTAIKYDQARRLARKQYRLIDTPPPRILRAPPKRKTKSSKVQTTTPVPGPDPGTVPATEEVPPPAVSESAQSTE